MSKYTVVRYNLDETETPVTDRKLTLSEVNRWAKKQELFFRRNPDYLFGGYYVDRDGEVYYPK